MQERSRDFPVVAALLRAVGPPPNVQTRPSYAAFSRLPDAWNCHPCVHIPRASGFGGGVGGVLSAARSPQSGLSAQWWLSQARPAASAAQRQSGWFPGAGRSGPSRALRWKSMSLPMFRNPEIKLRMESAQLAQYAAGARITESRNPRPPYRNGSFA